MWPPGSGDHPYGDIVGSITTLPCEEDTMKRTRTGMLALVAALPLAFGAVACETGELEPTEDGGVEDGTTDDGL